MVQMSTHRQQAILVGLTVFITRQSDVQLFTVAAIKETHHVVTHWFAGCHFEASSSVLRPSPSWSHGAIK